MKTRIGNLAVSYTARGAERYSIELWHDGLKKHRIIPGTDRHAILRKAELQAADWDTKWSQAVTREEERQQREGQKRQQEENRNFATERTVEAQQELDRLRSTLLHTLSVDDTIDWNDLKNVSEFPEKQPPKPQLSEKPAPQDTPPEPVESDSAYNPKFGLFDKLFRSRQERVLEKCKQKLVEDHAQWKARVDAITAANATMEEEYQNGVAQIESKYNEDLQVWNERRAAFLEAQKLSNEAIDKQREAYLSHSPEAIIEYCDLVLSLSDYPDYFPQEFSLDYVSESKLLLVDYALPAPNDIPTLREVKYIASRGEFVKNHLPQSQQARLYDDLLYQITLRTVHELFEADVIGALESIVFNGIVTAVERSSGNELTACVMSVQAKRDEFLTINLANVDPKACFKSLKGVGSSKLHSLAAVPPIMRLERSDSRFVEAYEVAGTLDEGSNLASMDWQDFEHLVRELFEAEFSVGGGEVKVTQASRDGGVDAIAFDPDPIRGGKIVIQAKRYANTVGVGAVRDLYGTLMNEGATKGILVTTSDYGPDAYAFANGKPITLLNGANLLHLLEKHGHRARIDLNEARQRSDS